MNHELEDVEGLLREQAKRIEALEAALRPALVELLACSVQLKARKDGSIARAIEGIRAALVNQQDGQHEVGSAISTGSA